LVRQPPGLLDPFLRPCQTDKNSSCWYTRVSDCNVFSTAHVHTADVTWPYSVTENCEAEVNLTNSDRMVTAITVHAQAITRIHVDLCPTTDLRSYIGADYAGAAGKSSLPISLPVPWPNRDKTVISPWYTILPWLQTTSPINNSKYQ